MKTKNTKKCKVKISDHLQELGNLSSSAHKPWLVYQLSRK
jgi:hypothetical protein